MVSLGGVLGCFRIALCLKMVLRDTTIPICER